MLLLRKLVNELVNGGGLMMEIVLEFHENRAFIKISGSISGEDIFLLQEKLQEVLDSGVKVLQMDLSACKSVSSSGIGKILYFYRDFEEKGGVFEIVKSSPNVYELFTTIKLNQLFSINL